MRTLPLLSAIVISAASLAALPAADERPDRESQAFVSGYVFAVGSLEISRAATLTNLITDGVIPPQHRAGVWAKIDDSLLSYLSTRAAVTIRPPIYAELDRTEKRERTESLRSVLERRRAAGVVNADAEAERKLAKLADELAAPGK
jgi:hypothetical protein